MVSYLVLLVSYFMSLQLFNDFALLSLFCLFDMTLRFQFQDIRTMLRLCQLQKVSKSNIAKTSQHHIKQRKDYDAAIPCYNILAMIQVCCSLLLLNCDYIILYIYIYYTYYYYYFHYYVNIFDCNCQYSSRICCAIFICLPPYS